MGKWRKSSFLDIQGLRRKIISNSGKDLASDYKNVKEDSGLATKNV